MAGLNKVMLIGNLGRDPEVRHTGDGKPVVTLNVATSETWKDKATGERKERTEWHRVVIFNEGLCKVAQQYLKKGSKIYVEGQLQTRKWTDHQSGQDKYSTEILLRAFNGTLVLLDKTERAAPSEDDYGTTRTREERQPLRDEMDDEIPF